MPNQINDFLTAFSGDARYCLSIPVLWTVSIDGISQSTINSTLALGGEKWQAKMTPNDMTKGGNILPAQNVTLPNESSSFQPMKSGSGMGGFLPGYGLEERSDFLSRSFTVNFLETNNDLVHEFFQPWMIAVGIKGLVENGPSLRGDMTVRQYSNDGKFRKGYQFKKIFPTNVEGFTLNYDNTDFLIKSVTFGCENYSQL